MQQASPRKKAPEQVRQSILQHASVWLLKKA